MANWPSGVRGQSACGLSQYISTPFWSGSRRYSASLTPWSGAPSSGMPAVIMVIASVFWLLLHNAQGTGARSHRTLTRAATLGPGASNKETQNFGSEHDDAGVLGLILGLDVDRDQGILDLG